jgi:hypothetical protein
MLFDRRKAVLAKIETTYGTDSVPTGAANAILTKDFELMPMEGEDESRNLDRPFMGGEPSIATGLHRKVRFKVELQASGTLGAAPAWGPLMRGCGCAQTINAGISVVYSAVSTAFEALSIYFNQDGVNFALIGARGTCRIELDAQKIPHLVFEFTGLFVMPTDTAMPTVDVSGFQAPVVANSANTPTFTLGAYAPILRSFKFDLGNKVEPRFLIRSEAIIIADRMETIEFTAEAKTMATWNYFLAARDSTTVALTLQHGTTAGRRCTLAAPLFQYQRPTGFRAQQGIIEATLKGVPLPNAGNDQWTLTLT